MIRQFCSAMPQNSPTPTHPPYSAADQALHDFAMALGRQAAREAFAARLAAESAFEKGIPARCDA